MRVSSPNALADGGEHHRSRNHPMQAFSQQFEPFHTSLSQDNRVKLARIELRQTRLDVAANGCDLEIGATIQ